MSIPCFQHVAINCILCMPFQINLCANIMHVTKLPLPKQTNGSISRFPLAHSSGGEAKKQNKKDVTKSDVKIVLKIVNYLYI